MKTLFAVFLLSAALAVAQEKKPEEKPAVKAPAISKDLQGKYFKAAAQQAQAQLVLANAQKDVDQKNQNLQIIVAEINSVCGPDAPPSMDKAGDPVCTPKAPEPKK